MQPLYEGKAKRLWETDNADTLRMEFKNDATAFNGEKKASFENKGRLNNSISTLIYQYLGTVGVPTHFVRQIDDTNVEVRKVEILTGQHQGKTGWVSQNCIHSVETR